MKKLWEAIKSKFHNYYHGCHHGWVEIGKTTIYSYSLNDPAKVIYRMQCIHCGEIKYVDNLGEDC